MSTLRFALVPFALSALLAQSPAGPTFAAGDIASLECRVVTTKAVDDYTQLLTVEVRNKGSVGAEPLEFRIELPAKKPDPPRIETFARAQLPHVARYGRPAAAGGKQTYVLPTRLAGKKAQFTVRVTAASFVEHGVVNKPELVFGKPEQVQRTSLAGTFPVTQVRVQNPLDHDVDVLLLVKLEQPKDLTELFGLRLAANATRDVVIATRPPAEAYLDALSESPGCAIKATSFTVVDWCLVGARSPDAGLASLREAYEVWYRWPEADPAVAGDFTFRERRARLNAPKQFDDFLVKGRFTIATTGAVQVEIIDGQGANASFLLRDAFSNLRRPDFDTLAKSNRLLPVTADRFALIGPGWDLFNGDAGRQRVAGDVKAEESPDVEVHDGRITGSGQGAGERAQWEWQAVNGAAVVTRRCSASVDTRYGYTEHDGRLVPSGASQLKTNGGTLLSATELTLTNLKFDGVTPIAAKTPIGDGAEALRTLWDAAYHLPTTPIEIEAKFEVKTGNDGVWRGHDKLTGKIVMQGIGRHMRTSDCQFDGGFAREDELQLAAILRDRLLMWYGRDFNDRPEFDEFFRGAVIQRADGSGTFAIDGGAVEGVFTGDGLVRGFRWRGGSATKFTFVKLGDHRVVTRIDEQIGGDGTPAARRWDAATLVTLTPVGEHMLPSKIVFEHIFGREWAAETVVFRDWRLRGQ